MATTKSEPTYSMKKQEKDKRSDMSNYKLSISSDGLGNYIPVPSALVGEIASINLIIYGTLLSRALISKKNRWGDEEGYVYVIYPIKNLARDIKKSESVVKRGLRELENKKLIERRRVGFNKPNRIYVLVPEECLNSTHSSGVNATTYGSKVNYQLGPKRAPKVINKNNNYSFNNLRDKYGEDETL